MTRTRANQSVESGDVPFVIVNRIRQGRALSRRGVPGYVRVYLDTFGYTSMLSHEIYDIGTEILYETCDGHNSTQNAPKSMIPVRVCTDFCIDSESAIKTRF